MQKGIIRPILSLMAAIAIGSGFAAELYAQEYESTPVTISKEKLRIGDQVCYSHIVLERQTLFSICQAYNVTLEDIYKYNPSVKEKGLQKNSILRIPVKEAAEELKSEPAAEAASAPLQEVITETEKPQEPGPETAETSRRIHTVKWYEDLDVIADKYGVTVEAIMKANGLKGRKLSRRQQLVIPAPGEVLEIETEEITEPVADNQVSIQTDTVQIADTVVKEEKKGLADFLFPKKETSLSLLLPFKATGSTSSTGNMDFYSGVLMAVYDMAEEGYDTQLNVYDTAGGKMPVTKERLEESDIVIGPVSPTEISQAFETGPDAKAIVSPLDQRALSLVESYRAMIQAPTPHYVLYNDLIAWIKEDMDFSDRLLVISEKGAKQTETVVEMKAAIDSSGLEYKPLSYSILEGRNVTGSLEYLMTESGTNRVYIASDSEAFVNDVVRNLNVMIHKKYEVVLYAPSRIRNYETIEVENFHNASLHISAGYHIDYDDARVQEFLLKYRALFNTEPTQFAFQGYDLASYFIELNARYGNRWYERLDEADKSMLQSTFRFRRDGNGGYVNTGVRRIIYGEDWSVKKIR